MDKSKIPLLLTLAALFAVPLGAAGCAATGKAVVEQYQEVTPTRFEGAVAVVLEEREAAKVDDKGEGIVTEGFRRLKILDRKAMDCGAEATNCRLMRFVCYEETWDEVELIEARTILPDGEVIEVEKDDMSDRTFTTWSVPDQDQRCWVWRMKGAVPGAIFEERYRIRSSKIFQAGGFWFQDRDPVLEATFTLDAPADYQYRWKTYNIDLQPTEKKVENRLIRTWTARDITPIVVENGMVAPDDVAAKLLIANNKISAWAEISDKCNDVKTWEGLGNCWHDMIVKEKKQETTDAVKEIAKEIAKTAKTETEKLKAIWKWLNDNVRYVGLERGLAGWIPLSAHVVCTKKYGDCKAVAGLISVLCRELGMKADPILIGTRPQLGSLDTEMPGPFYFNHSIARVEADGKVYWMDATHRNLDYKTTPARNQGVHVVVARPDGKSFLDFIPIQPPESNGQELLMVFTPTGNGGMKADFDYTTTGNVAEYFRMASHQLMGEKWVRWIENWTAESYPQVTVTDQSFTGKEDNNAPFNIKIKAQLKQVLQPAGKGVSFEVKPFLMGSLIDYFQLPKRRYMLDISYKSSGTARYEVVIPEGMEPAGLPKNITIDDEFVMFERLSQIENDRVVTQMKSKMKMNRIPPEKYPQARESFQKLWDAGTYVLVFEPVKKKSS